MSSAPKVVRGKLTFKGDAGKPKVKLPSSHGKRPLNQESEAQQSSSAGGAEIEILGGTGRITSSGTTVHGHGTQFMSQLSVGDAVIVTHPTTLAEETKIVRMVLSNVSIGISSPFSTDLVSTCPFRYIKAPKQEEDLEEKERQATLKKHKMEEAAFGTYASKGGTQFTYRVKKETAYGGYKVITETTDGNMSREELLDKRSKKKADRFCY